MKAKELSALLQKLEACSTVQEWAEGKTLAAARAAAAAEAAAWAAALKSSAVIARRMLKVPR